MDTLIKQALATRKVIEKRIVMPIESVTLTVIEVSSSES